MAPPIARALADHVTVAAAAGADAPATYDPDARLFVNINTPHGYARARYVVMLDPSDDRITEKL